MSKREKIIVGLMVAAIVYGAYNFLFSSSTGNRKQFFQKSAAPLGEFVADLLKRIREADTTKTDTLVLTKSAVDWKKDPFLVVKKIVEKEVETKDPEIINSSELTGAFRYSGYMEMGSRKLAIINGMEYQKGEQLDNLGATLKSITPGEVRIYVDAEQGIVVVPIDETAQ